MGFFFKIIYSHKILKHPQKTLNRKFEKNFFLDLFDFKEFC